MRKCLGFNCDKLSPPPSLKHTRIYPTELCQERKYWKYPFFPYSTSAYMGRKRQKESKEEKQISTWNLPNNPQVSLLETPWIIFVIYWDQQPLNAPPVTIWSQILGTSQGNPRKEGDGPWRRQPVFSPWGCPVWHHKDLHKSLRAQLMALNFSSLLKVIESPNQPQNLFSRWPEKTEPP